MGWPRTASRRSIEARQCLWAARDCRTGSNLRLARNSSKCGFTREPAKSGCPGWSAPSHRAEFSTRARRIVSTWAGMIWGIGSAIHEQTEIDPRTSRYVNANLADYMIPVNADVGEVHIIMVPEEDRLINPIGVKGIGEIGIVGTSAALANAIYHATGQRLRDLPLRIDGLITGV
jgi:hypothetical protein